jgi:hypothetical protein
VKIGTVVVAWTGAEPLTGEPKPCAAVWKNRATERDVASAQEYASTLEDGRVHIVTGRFELASFKQLEVVK